MIMKTIDKNGFELGLQSNMIGVSPFIDFSHVYIFAAELNQFIMYTVAHNYSTKGKLLDQDIKW